MTFFKVRELVERRRAPGKKLGVKERAERRSKSNSRSSLPSSSYSRNALVVLKKRDAEVAEELMVLRRALEGMLEEASVLRAKKDAIKLVLGVHEVKLSDLKVPL